MLYGGLIAALVTPYTKYGEVDYLQIKKIVRYLINEVIEGFYVCGSTGEAFLLSEKERKKILEAVIDENNGEKIVICHCGAISTEHMKSLALHANKAGASAVSSIPPFYYKFNTDEIIKYFIDLVDSAELPVIVYNFPEQTGFSITLDILSRMLKESPGIIGIKYTSYDLYQLERIKTKYPKLVVFNGHDEVYLSSLIIGVDGAIGSTFNAIPQVYRKIEENFAAGDFGKALEYQRFANDFIDLVLKIGVIQSVKEFLSFFGFDCNGARKPFGLVNKNERNRLKLFYERYVTYFK